MINDFCKVKLFLSDVDGVMTDGGVYLTESGDEMKRFYIPDGMGLVLLKKIGIRTGIVTSENLKMIEVRAARLKLDYLRMGQVDKLSAVEAICQEMGCQLREVAFIGDDVNDFRLLTRVGFPACPANAQPIIKSIAGIHILEKEGGFGAVREFINQIVGEAALVEAWNK